MKSITNPVEIAKKAAESYKSLYGEDLISVILYGSAAGGDFDPDRSDINLLIVLRSMDLELIAKSSDLQSKLYNQRINTPLFMNRQYIEKSLDSYPVEFLDMKGCYKVLYGEDVLYAVSPQNDHLRLQIERELKGKWLHLLQEFPHARKNRKSLLELISLSLRAYAPFFRSLLRLKGETVPHNRKELYKNIEKAFNISGEPLQRVADSNNVKDLPELEKLFSDYVKAIRAIIEVIDQ